MLTRVPSFFTFFDVGAEDRHRGREASRLSGERAEGMTHTKDYEALAAVALHFKPRRIFEIGTFLGITSDFFLSLLPESQVVSIAFLNPRLPLLGKKSNNSELSREQVGSGVHPERRNRFTQLYGDSHRLSSDELLRRFGPFDLTFIDGDHSREGVMQDTGLAQRIMARSGVICWHDANPKPRYGEVRKYLELEMPLLALGTTDDYVGGVACWSRSIDERLRGNLTASRG